MSPKLQLVACLSLLLLSLSADAASLRRQAQAAVSKTTAGKKQPSADALDSALNLVKEVSAKHHPKSDAATSNSTQPTQRAKLDVGFAGFTSQVLAKLTGELQNATQGQAWTKEMREKLEANVSETLKTGISLAFKPIKQSIGKTWMALPEDEQKNQLVAQLKQAFTSVFASGLETFDSHVSLGLMRMKNMHGLDNVTLVSKSADFITQSVLEEHCYQSLALKAKANASKASNASTAPTKFCIQSVLAGLAHRLNDSQSLYSMSMRFESGAALSLAQKKSALSKKKA